MFSSEIVRIENMYMKKTGLLAIFFALTGYLSAQESTDANFKTYTQNITGTQVNFKMVAIPGGSFTMGSAASEKGRDEDEGPQRKITISPFWMSEHEVTYDEYFLFYNDENTSRNNEVDAVTRPTPQYIDLSWGMGKQGGYPFNSMSQYTAIMYCRWLYKKTGIFYRLPTEAEWEYACRAGTNTIYYFGDNETQLKDYAWYAKNSDKKYHPVMQKKPNAWGLYDMLGNVAEWTLDQYDQKYCDKITDGSKDPKMAPATKYPKSVKGGGFDDPAHALRCSNRDKSDAAWNRRDPQIPKSKWWLTDAAAVGFRIIRPSKQPTPEEAESFFKLYLGK